MSNADAVNQDANIQVPRRGQCLAQTVDVTARKLDLRLLAFNGAPYLQTRKEALFLNLYNDSATVTLYFYCTNDEGAADLSEAAVIAAGTPLTGMPTTHCYAIPPLGERSFRIFRDTDWFLVVKASATTTTLRLAVTSDSTPRLYRNGP